MSDTVISAENLSKSYLVGHKFVRAHREQFREVVGREARNIVRNAVNIARGRQVVLGDQVEEFWALKDVSFEAKRGEVLGVIGRNGAGKSTLLKILSRITEPTEGRVVLRGRVASLLEVGTGFHGELTGRENIYLNGAILGMTRREISGKFDEIVAFAEVERFLDTPVKRYSSGMYVRLAFAIAAHLEPEILIVDEVLAVGDIEFQKKCLGKMDAVSRKEGRTVLVVSHNNYVIQNLCQRCILLDHGKLRAVGVTSNVLASYIQESIGEATLNLANASRNMTPSGELRLISFTFNTPYPLLNRETCSATLEIQVNQPIGGVVFGIGFSTVTGQRLLSCDSDFFSDRPFAFPHPGRYLIDVSISSLPLTPSPYLVDVGCRTTSGLMLDEVSAFTLAEVFPGETTPPNELGSFPTVCHPSTWRCCIHPLVSP